MFDFGIVTNWIDELLNGFMPSWLATTVECALVGVMLLVMYSLLAIFYIFYERKVCAWFQCRLGPMRVGPWGVLQVFADVIKILLKELITLWNTDRLLFALAPYLVIVASFLVFACLPWGKGLQVIDFNVGVFFMMAASSLGVIGILLAGWSSNSKYTLIGAMRSGAQMISYELSIGLAMLCIVCLAGTMSVSGIVEAQADGWFLFRGHIPAVIAFIIYLIAATAETNRGPFDLPEAEHELAASTSASSLWPNSSTCSSSRASPRCSFWAAGCHSTCRAGTASTPSWTMCPRWCGSLARPCWCHSSSSGSSGRSPVCASTRCWHSSGATSCPLAFATS